MTNRQILSFYLDALRPQRKLLLGAVVFACLKAAMESPVPKAIGFAVDKLAKSDLAWFSAHQTPVLLVIAGYLLFFAPVMYFRMVLPSLVALRVFFSLRVRLWLHLQGLSADFYARNRAGDLTARLVTDIQTASTTAVSVITRVAFDIFIFVPAFYLMLRTSWELTVIIMIYSAVQLYLVRRMMPEIRRQSKIISQKLGEISSEATEKIEGAMLVRAFAKEQEVAARFENLNRDHLFLSTRLLRYSTWRTTVIHAADAFVPILIALVGVPLARNGRLSAGDIVAVILYQPIVSGPLFRFTDALSQWAQAAGSIQRVNEVFGALPSVKDKPDAAPLPRGPGRVTFRKVEFAYPPLTPDAAPSPVIHDFSLDVEPGKMVALVGPSGSGKTTMSQLLLRFYDVNAGAIEIDGHDIRAVTQASLRQSIGIVMQKPVIFAGSIMDNLRFVKPDATEAEVRAALEFAALGDFIDSLPLGVNTALGEAGVNLSGGQQQRLSIARVFLKDPMVLILDEATSALDARSERQIQEQLEQLMVGRTTIVIAHRLSTVRRADRIVVLRDGRIAESGSHAALMEKRGFYYNLVSIQAYAGEDGVEA